MEAEYLRVVTTPTDIYEHIPILKFYAQDCGHVTEIGAGIFTAAWGLLKGLQESKAEHKRLISIHTNYDAELGKLRKIAAAENISFTFKHGDSLVVELERTELTFLDGQHIYGQMKRELEKFAPLTKKYLIMHDTTIDAERGEALRCGYDPQIMAEETGYSLAEITCGIWPAIEEFLADHPEWELVERYINCNGLTILQRK